MAILFSLSNNCVWFSFWVEKDAFVLCRIFHKSNIGPPSGQRYAPFIEEEWDDDDSAVVPGVDNANEVVARRHAIGGNGHRMYIESNAHDTHVEGNTVMQVSALCASAIFHLIFFLKYAKYAFFPNLPNYVRFNRQLDLLCTELVIRREALIINDSTYSNEHVKQFLFLT